MFINLWSSPRNVSTAMMYSFAQRTDIQVYDEPFYGHFLKFTGAKRPDRAITMANMECDSEKVLANIALATSTKHQFLKNISVQLAGLNDDFIGKSKNIILIRNPKDTLLSYTKVIKQPTIDDVGYKHQCDIYNKWHKKGNINCIVNSTDILKNPKLMLAKICNSLNIEFDSNMLNWKKGARPEDGPWAKYWYANVHNSTGFMLYKENLKPLPQHLQALHDECLTYYDFLNNRKLT